MPTTQPIADAPRGGQGWRLRLCRPSLRCGDPRGTGERGVESGAALVEVALALALLILVLAPTAVMLQNAFEVGADTRLQVVAAAIASSRLDAVSTEPFNSIPFGRTVTSTVVGKKLFTIDEDVELVGVRSGSGCSSGTTQQILRVTATVGWIGAPPAEDVVEATTVSPPALAFDPSTGSVAVDVSGAQNQAQANVSVGLTGPSSSSETTTYDGCAFFEGLSPGNYTVTLSAPGKVSDQEQVHPASAVSVVAGQTTGVQFAYDRGAAVAIDLSVTSGQPATGLAVSVGNTHLLPAGWLASSPGTQELSPLYPFSSGYGAWAGDCEESDPTGVDTQGQPLYPGATAPTPAAVSPGATTTIPVALTPLTVEVVAGATPQAAAALTAVADGPGCPTDQLGMTVTGTDGTSVTGMALGHFAITATVGSATGTTDIWITPTQILAEPAGTPIAGPVVVSVA